MATAANSKYRRIAQAALRILGRACMSTAWRMGVLFGRTPWRAW